MSLILNYFSDTRNAAGFRVSCPCEASEKDTARC